VFDGVSHKDLYEQTASNLIDAIRDGENACLIAYGQTGTGKTYTMFGDCKTTSSSDNHIPEKEGIVQYFIRELMGGIRSQSEGSQKCTDGDDDDDVLLKEFPPVVMCSYVEIYQDKFRDLLASSDDEGAVTAGRFKVSSPKESRGRMNAGAVGGVFMSGAYWERCHEEGDVLNILNVGNQARSTSATNLNSASSRSHAIFTIKLLYPGCEPQYVHFVDLAGSELASKTNALGQTMQEAKTINKSLSALGNVVRAVTQGRSHVPYRDSKLTYFLQDAIGGSSVTSIILTVSPMASDSSETMSTIRFGHRAKKVTNKKQSGDCDKDDCMQHSTIMAASSALRIEDHFGDNAGNTKDHVVGNCFDDVVDEGEKSFPDSESVSSFEMAAETTIVPSEPSPSNGSVNRESPFFESPEASLRASMLDSSIFSLELDSVSSNNNASTTLIQPEHPSTGSVPSERYPFNSPLSGSSTANSAFMSKKSNMHILHNSSFGKSNDLYEVCSTPNPSATGGKKTHAAREDNNGSAIAKLTHNPDSYVNVGRQLFDSSSESPPQNQNSGLTHPGSWVQPKVANSSLKKKFSRAAGFLGALVFLISAIQNINRDGEGDVGSELDYCPASAQFPLTRYDSYTENATNIHTSIRNSTEVYTEKDQNPYTASMEKSQRDTREILAIALVTVAIVIFSSTLLVTYGKKKQYNTQGSEEDGVNVSDDVVLNSLTKPILKDILRKKNMKVSGTKQVLIDRLRGSVTSSSFKTPTPRKKSRTEWNEDLSGLTVSMLKTRLREKGLKVSGAKADLFLRLKLADDSNDLTKSELKDMLSKKGLKVSGKKTDLANRLVEANF